MIYVNYLCYNNRTNNNFLFTSVPIRLVELTGIVCDENVIIHICILFTVQYTNI